MHLNFAHIIDFCSRLLQYWDLIYGIPWHVIVAICFVAVKFLKNALLCDSCSLEFGLVCNSPHHVACCRLRTLVVVSSLKTSHSFLLNSLSPEVGLAKIMAVQDLDLPSVKGIARCSNTLHGHLIL